MIHWCGSMTTPSHNYSTVRCRPKPKPVVAARQMLGLMMSAGVPSDYYVHLNELLGALVQSQTSVHPRCKPGDFNGGSIPPYYVRKGRVSGQLVSLLISRTRIAFGNRWIS